MLGDTIFAVASPPGGSARGVLRISGPRARAAAAAVLDGAELPPRRAALARTMSVLGFAVPVDVLVMPAPGSYTGEDVVELHLLGSPQLLEQTAARLRDGEDVRDATPGEFTRRAFVGGRLDLASVEAVAALIHARDDAARRRAVEVLAGGLTAAVAALRGQLDDARALLEAGLDFLEDETGAVDAASVAAQLDAATDGLRALAVGAPQGAIPGEVLVLGAANAGKSSLVNALVPSAAVLVAADPGTTRDVLRIELGPGVALLDAPGDLPGRAVGSADRAALAQRARQLAVADATLWVVDPGIPVPLPPPDPPPCAVVLTKQDLPARAAAPCPAGLPAGVPVFRTSSVTGVGLPALRGFLLARGEGGGSGGGLGYGARVADALGRAASATDRAQQALRGGLGLELAALELGDAVVALDAIAGRSCPEDLLDRIFAGFCLGK